MYCLATLCACVKATESYRIYTVSRVQRSICENGHLLWSAECSLAHTNGVYVGYAGTHYTYS